MHAHTSVNTHTISCITAHTLSHRYVLTVDAEGLLQFHMRTGGLIHSANANHSHPVTALGVGQVSAAAARSQPRAIYSGGARATIPMFEAMPMRCRVSGWRAWFDSTVDAAGTCLPTGSLGHGRDCINARFAAQWPNSFAPVRGYSLQGCSGCTLGYSRVPLGTLGALWGTPGVLWMHSRVLQGTLGLLEWHSAVQRPNSFAIATGDANGDIKVHSVATAPRQASLP